MTHDSGQYSEFVLKKTGTAQALPPFRVHSPIGGTPPSLLPLPHNRCGFRRGLHCGGEGRGEGARAGDVPPHPNPLPRNLHKVKATSFVGERGPDTANGRMHSHSGGIRGLAADAAAITATCCRRSHGEE